MEKLLGEWHIKRNNRESLVIIAKGAHTPNCNPQGVSDQLTESLERLKIDCADIYIMHRDNIDVPIDEFIDVLNKEKEKGRIKIFGGSNWTLSRFRDANNWANKNNKQPMSILNNNLSLSKMIQPLWDGCISSNDENILKYLEETQTAHLSWSSQGRGYFLPPAICQAIEDRITAEESSWRKLGEHSSGPLSCFDSEDNRERRNRANEFASELDVTTQNIAGAWPLNQSFPSFALIGPRKIDEIDTSLPSLDITITKEKTNWLNLN
jgi:aryl-alcohol dehydrogenase-like predicted oxidoreductase